MLISDIHLRDYHRYNKFPSQRLHSFVELAKDIVKIGKDNDIDTLLIGGDIVDKNTVSPTELHTLFTMFNHIAKQFRVYSIIGNHDAKSKKDIDKEDTVITLLETIDGISFHHQEILEIGGRTIAFENWMPNYDLSWITEPVDIYMSHATIDYNGSGFFGMDTSVFEGKFEIGVFGDIHVTEQLGNLVSIGNTKQESRSDKYQGGVMIMDLEDLSYERIPIDPEHKKYLYLQDTEDEDEEGWVDKDGDDMTYRVFTPAKVKSKTFELTLPKITDIEVKTHEVMKSEGLLSLHKSIKETSNYEPIDFNFQLNYLTVKNFRSIGFYTLDLSNNYIITGHTGSGKSTLITALFYALIGNKKLKSEIKYGESSCQLKVSLDYQGINYVISRGTGKGDYGLIVDSIVKKYNSKAEFEKEVFEYLPFLNYHESFFFNYWDTELLGNLKVDRRYDLLAKYYRLDALSSYNDTAEAKFKIKRKELKDCTVEIQKLEVLRDSRLEDFKTKKQALEGKPSEKELKGFILSHKNYKEIVKEIEEKKVEEKSHKEVLSKYEKEISSKKSLISGLESLIRTGLTSSELTKSMEDYNERKTLSGRIEKGTSVIEKIESDMQVSRSMRSMYVEQKDSITITPEEKLGLEKDPVISRLNEVNSCIRDIEGKLLQTEAEIKGESIALKSKIDDVEKALAEAKSSDNSICSSCNQSVCNKDHIETLKDKLESLEESKLSIKKSWEEHLKDKEEKGKKISTLKEEKGELHQTLTKIDIKLKKIEDDEKKLDLLNEQISSCDNSISELSSKHKSFTESLEGLKSQLEGIPVVSDEDYLKYSSDKETLVKIVSEKELLESLESKLKEKSSKLDLLLVDLNSDIDSLNKKLEYFSELPQEKYDEYVHMLSLHSQMAECEKDLNSSQKKLSKEETTLRSIQDSYDKLESYCLLTSRSGVILKSILEELTKTFSSTNFKFTTAKVQANGKVITDMSVSYLVGKKWIPYSSLSSGQRTLCDLYYISKIITGVGIVSFDETLRFLDDENLKFAVDLIDSIKKSTILISTHSSNLSMEGTMNLRCELQSGNTTDIELVV